MKLAVSPWEKPDVVASFAQANPNPQLLKLASNVLTGKKSARILDIGCGAGRNTLSLAELGQEWGWQVVGIDSSRAMLDAAQQRADASIARHSIKFYSGSMEELVSNLDMKNSAKFDLIVAHGIWNLASSGKQFRIALSQASQCANPGAKLFVFTFARKTFLEQEKPLKGEDFVFIGLNDEPQCFLDEEQLDSELAKVGFSRPKNSPLTIYNKPLMPAKAGRLSNPFGSPVIYEGVWEYLNL